METEKPARRQLQSRRQGVQGPRQRDNAGERRSDSGCVLKVELMFADRRRECCEGPRNAQGLGPALGQVRRESEAQVFSFREAKWTRQLDMQEIRKAAGRICETEVQEEGWRCRVGTHHKEKVFKPCSG